MLISTLIVKTARPGIAAAILDGDPMTVLPQINTFGRVAEFARGFRVRFAAAIGVRGSGATSEVDLVGEPGGA